MLDQGAYTSRQGEANCNKKGTHRKTKGKCTCLMTTKKRVGQTCPTPLNFKLWVHERLLSSRESPSEFLEPQGMGGIPLGAIKLFPGLERVVVVVCI